MPTHKDYAYFLKQKMILCLEFADALFFSVGVVIYIYAAWPQSDLRCHF